jgi:hypothetical protein
MQSGFNLLPACKRDSSGILFFVRCVGYVKKDTADGPTFE